MTDAANSAPAAGPNGLGGWLILVVIGTVLSPIMILFTGLVPVGGVIFSPEFSKLAGNIQIILVIELAVNVALVLAWLYAAFLLFKKKRVFPKIFIAVLAASLVALLFDMVATSAFLKLTPGSEEIRDAVRAMLACIIWIPYMLVSKRVRNTFVE